MQSVVKYSASKPNRSWKQKPFPKSHSRTPPLFSSPWLLSPLFPSVAAPGMPLCISRICLCSRVHHFTVAESSVNVKTRLTKAHKGSSGDRTAAWDERTPRERGRKSLLKQRETKKKVCEGEMKRRGEKTSKGKRRGGPQGYSLCLGPENSVWHRVWHLTVMRLPVRWCMGIVPVSFRFSRDSCLSFVSILVVSDSEVVTQGLNPLGGAPLVQEIHGYTRLVV